MVFHTHLLAGYPTPYFIDRALQVVLPHPQNDRKPLTCEHPNMVTFFRVGQESTRRPSALLGMPLHHEMSNSSSFSLHISLLVMFLPYVPSHRYSPSH